MRKKHFLIVLSLLFIFSCTREYSTEANNRIEDNTNAWVGKVNFQEMENFIQKNTKKQIPNYLKLHNLGKRTEQYITDIDTTDIIKVVHDSITSFTIKVNTLSDKDFTFSNLVINVKNNKIEEYIYHYKPEAQWLRAYIAGEENNYEGVLKITDIDGNDTRKTYSRQASTPTTCMVYIHEPCYGSGCPCTDYNGVTYYMAATCGGGGGDGNSGDYPSGELSGGGGGGTVPSVPTSEQINSFIAFLSPSIHAYITQNTNTLTDINNYFIQNGLSPKHQSFITSILEYVERKDIAWFTFSSTFNSAVAYKKQYPDNWIKISTIQDFAFDFMLQNPNTSWTQFQNWFMGESEGQDGEYDLASEIAFQQQQFQKHSLPSMTSYENAFPSNPNATYPNYYRDAAPNYEVYNNYVGGRLKQLFNQNGGNIIGNPYRNACAVRQSFTHNKLGIMIPFQHNDHKGDYNWNYILTASKMGVFLEGTYGPPTHKLIGTDANDLKKIGDFLKGKTGIYLVINNDPSKNTGAGYTGHTDMIKNGYVSGGANVTNSSGQIVRGGIKYIYIWELK